MIKVGKIKKTNAMRILDKAKVQYKVHEYFIDDGFIDGVSVAHKIKVPEERVFKTLVTVGSSKEYFVFVIPVNKELDLKKAAKCAGEKKIDMIHVKDIVKITAYIKGGCSPIGMKKMYKTYIDSHAKEQENLVVSAGKIGVQVELSLSDLLISVSGELGDVIK